VALPEIENYTLIKPIGQGGMADVYLALQESVQREVAIKLLTSRPASDNNLGQRFIREARIASQLQHPNIVPVYDARQEGDYYYIVMEFLSHGDLKQRLERGLKIGEGLKILTQILSALEYASGKDFIHRDIKPENILFRSEDFPVLSDFGIARSMLTDTRMTLTGSILGTPQYMSPEQAQGIPLDGRSDLYSIGIILFELLTGYVPYSADSAISTGLRHITEPIPRLSRNLVDFQRVIDKALAKSPAQRFQTAREFINAILKLEKRLARKPQLLTRICHSNSGFSSSQRSQKTKLLTTTSPPRYSNSPDPLFEEHKGFTPESLRSLLTLFIGAMILIGGGSYLFLQRNTVSTEVQEDRLSRRSLVLLEKARTAINEQRYYQPAGDNAQDYLSALLTISPDDPEAIRQLERLTQIYIEEFSNDIKSHAMNEARATLARTIKNRQFINNSQLIEQINLLSFQLSRHETELRIKEQTLANNRDLAKRAAQAWQERKLFAESFENPIDLARLLLESDPNSEYAKQLLLTITDELSKQARQMIIQNRFSDARQLLDQAKRTGFTLSHVTAVENELNYAIDSRLNQLTATGKKMLEKLDYRGSYHIYQQIKAMQQKHPDADNLLRNIEKTIVAETRKLITSEHLTEARKNLEIAEQIMHTQTESNAGDLSTVNRSTLEGLQELQRELQTAVEQNRLKQKRIRELLNMAEKYLTQQQYNLPPGENAFDSYLQVLAIDSVNASAHSGQTNTARLVIETAERLLASNKVSQAKAMLSRLQTRLSEKNTLQNKIRALLTQAEDLTKILALLAQAASINEEVSADAEQRVKIYQNILNIDYQHAYALAKLAEATAFAVWKTERALDQSDSSTASKLINHLKTFANSAHWQPLEARLKHEIVKQEQVKKNVSAIENIISHYQRSETAARSAVLNRLTNHVEALESVLPENSSVVAKVKSDIADFYADVIVILVSDSQLDKAILLGKRLNEVNINSNKLDAGIALLNKQISTTRPELPAIGVF
jgi:serine/threonine-protein kinase PpkA